MILFDDVVQMLALPDRDGRFPFSVMVSVPARKIRCVSMPQQLTDNMNRERLLCRNINDGSRGVSPFEGVFSPTGCGFFRWTKFSGSAVGTGFDDLCNRIG
jgi:hypothetical protein